MVYRHKQSHKHKIAAATLAVLLGFVAYDLVARSAIAQNQPASPSGPAAPVTPATILDNLKSIKLDGKILNDDAFLSLIDRTTPIPVYPYSRPNPFAKSSALKTAKIQTTQGSAQR